MCTYTQVETLGEEDTRDELHRLVTRCVCVGVCVDHATECTQGYNVVG